MIEPATNPRGTEAEETLKSKEYLNASLVCVA